MPSKCRSSSKGNHCLIRKRPVSFGNPRTATYHGNVFTTYNGAKTLPPIVQKCSYVQNMVAMVHVPPEQVPEGVLNLVRSHRPWIDHIRIVIEQVDDSSSNLDNEEEEDVYANEEKIKEEKEEGGLQSQSLKAASCTSISAASNSLTVPAMENVASVHDAEEDEVAGSQLDLVASDNRRQPVKNEPVMRTYLILFQLDSDAAAEQIIQFLHNQPYSCLDETQICNIYPVVALQTDDDAVSLMSPFLAGVVPLSNASVDPAVMANTSAVAGTERACQSMTADDYHNCAVCLEHLQWGRDDLISSSAAASAAAPSSDEQRSILTTVCNHSFHIDCLLQWQDSPCPVCRYDHSGLNGAVLTQCSQCERTDQVMVCLICGVTSCGGATSATSSDQSLSTDAGASTANGDVDELQVLANNMSTSHARRHYNETLHAYALDTETQHVWDFVGGGYVHRLLQNKDDGKLVEVSDPNNASTFERTQNPGLSDSQEGEVVHRKLEGYASQYYTLLKSQLEQQRLYYEGRLEEVRREYEPPPAQLGRRKGESTCSTLRTTPDLIAALKQERRQLAQRLERLQERDDRLRSDVSALKSMNESISENIVQYKNELAKVQKERLEYQKSFQESFPALEQRVTQLMLQLEAGDGAPPEDDRKPAAK
ncbi:hypothetical protein MPSEU_000317700 [Mayamaea pseudoterrestris]|nr:hypothetical protein MPSEU_000317700 [Mayamaea pseudoterrestris]